MKYFKFVKEEQASLTAFRKTCVKRNLEMILSRNALEMLKYIADSHGDADMNVRERDHHTLSRRGLIRTDSSGLPVITELGFLTLAYAEAGGLIEVKEPKEAPKEAKPAKERKAA